MSFHTSIPLALLAFAGAAVSTHAQCLIPKLVHADRQTADHLGSALAVTSRASGPYCVAGIGADNTPAGANTGSVRIFRPIGATWSEFAAMAVTAPDGQSDDSFGASVACTDPYLIVGATGVGTTGAAYIFRRSGDTFIHEGKLIPDGSAANDEVGRSVAISGAYALIGAPGKDFDTSPNVGVEDADAGMVSFYKRDANGVWARTQTLADAFGGTSAGAGAGARLGAAVAMSGAVAVIGAPYGDAINWPTHHGYVHIMRRDDNGVWQNDAAIAYNTGNEVEEEDHYGAAVSTDGTSIAIGAPDDDALPSELPAGSNAKLNSGCVYFERYVGGNWASDGRAIPPDSADNARFGASVSIRGDECLIAAPGVDKAYIYRRTSPGHWSLYATINDPQDPSNFAQSVAFDGTNAFIGATTASDGGLLTTGAVFMYQPSEQYADTCEAAVPLSTSGGSISGCTTFAQANGTTTCGLSANGNGPDVWFSFTPSCTGPVTFDASESNYDTILSVHTACPTAAGTNTIVCNDDYNGSHQSRLSLNAVAGTRYLIRIGGFGGDSGFFTLMHWFPDTSNDICSTPVIVTRGNSYGFQNCSAATDGPNGASTCSSSIVGDLWYRFFSPVPGSLRLTTCGSDFDTILAVYPGAVCPGGAITELACNDDAGLAGPCPLANLTSAVTVGTLPVFPYTIRVGGFDGSDPTGNGVLHVDFVPNCTCDWNLSAVLSVQDIFDFLASYFSGDADFNQSGLTSVQDVFDFLACYFAGCA